MRARSPCKKQCLLQEGMCKSCNRTIEEITAWRDLTQEQKIEILKRIHDNTKQPKR